MTVIRQVLGWLSWYIVSTVLYAIVWTQLDGDLRFAMPAGVVLPLSGFLRATSAEATHEVFVWSTSIVGVVCIHVAAWNVLHRLKSARCAEKRRWCPAKRRVFTVVGWACWLLVSTSVLLAIGDAIREARGMNPSGDLREQSFAFVGGLVLMGLLHLAAVKVHRSMPHGIFSLITSFRRLVGWISWLIVAVHVYAFTWWSIDIDSYYVLPSPFYQWLHEVVQPMSCETSADLDDWSTAIVIVLALHLFSWALFSVLRRAFHLRSHAWSHYTGKMLAIAGWSSWLLVSTITSLIIIDEILRSRGGKLPNDV